MGLRVPTPGHHYLLWLWILACGVAVAGLRGVQVQVPLAVRKGELAVLHCYYDLEGDALYSVKWYIGRREFYRFTPRERPQLKVFPIIGLADLVVQKNCSNATQLCLAKVTLVLSGRYSCEVSADSPSFKTALVSSYMDVVVTPSHRPELRGMKPRYRVGDKLTASCVSRHSKPAANLTWSINGSPMKAPGTQEVRWLHEPGAQLVTALSSISVPLEMDHFTDSGRLKVRCTASLYNLYWQITENSAELERPRVAVVAASNAVDNRAIWRSEEKLTDENSLQEVSSLSSNLPPSRALVSLTLVAQLLFFFPHR